MLSLPKAVSTHPTLHHILVAAWKEPGAAAIAGAIWNHFIHIGEELLPQHVLNHAAIAHQLPGTQLV